MRVSAPVEVAGLDAFVQPYRSLFGDRRLFAGFCGAVAGILASGSTRVRQMARVTPSMGVTPHAERRLRRLIHHQNQRTELNAETLTERLQAQGAERVAGEAEVVVVLDGSDLRKPHSQKLEHLDVVRDLKGNLVPGYHTLNAIGLTPDGRQSLLYHRTYSTRSPGFLSENAVVLEALRQITRSLREVGVVRIIFVLDRGFDDLKVLKRLRRLKVDFVIRAQHVERRVRLQPTGENRALQAALQLAPVSHTFAMSRPVLREGKLSWRPTPAEIRAQEVWVDEGKLHVHALHLHFPTRPKGEQQGWTLLTSLPVSPGVHAGQVVRLYLRRWSTKDVFSWTKTALGWEQVRVLQFEALRTLVAMAWLAAAFVFTLGETVDTPEVKLLAHLGGAVPHKNRPPGKKTILLGLQRLSAAYLARHTTRQSEEHPSEKTLVDKLFGPQ
ncbi:transposase [Deinococcus hopiensis]|nr:transposase [Deinococcus hopiensis]